MDIKHLRFLTVLKKTCNIFPFAARDYLYTLSRSQDSTYNIHKPVVGHRWSWKPPANQSNEEFDAANQAVSTPIHKGTIFNFQDQHIKWIKQTLLFHKWSLPSLFLEDVLGLLPTMCWCHSWEVKLSSHKLYAGSMKPFFHESWELLKKPASNF